MCCSYGTIVLHRAYVKAATVQEMPLASKKDATSAAKCTASSREFGSKSPLRKSTNFFTNNASSAVCIAICASGSSLISFHFERGLLNFASCVDSTCTCPCTQCTNGEGKLNNSVYLTQVNTATGTACYFWLRPSHMKHNRREASSSKQDQLL